MSTDDTGRNLVLAAVLLVVCDVIGGFLAVSSGLNTWGQAWLFDANGTVPLPVGVAQLVLAWLAARNVRPPVGLVAAVLLAVFCLISVLFGLFDGDLTSEAMSTGSFLWGVVLLLVTAVVGLLAAARARQIRRGQ